MDLKAMLNYVFSENMSIDDSVQYIQSRLGQSAINKHDMQYWYNYVHRIRQHGRRCRCLHTGGIGCSTASSMTYCCENPFELRGQELVVGENVPKLVCDWSTFVQFDLISTYNMRFNKESFCILNKNYVIQHSSSLANVKVIDIIQKMSMVVEYKDSKLAVISKTSLSNRKNVIICDFQAIGPRHAILLIRSTDYFNHRPQIMHNGYHCSSAICLTEFNLDRGTYKFIDACVIEKLGVSLQSVYERNASFVANKFEENKQIAVMVWRDRKPAFLNFRVSNNRLQIGEIAELAVQEQNNQPDAAGNIHDIFMDFVPVHHPDGLVINQLFGNVAFERRRRRLDLLMQTFTNNKLYGFNYETRTSEFRRGQRHIKLLLDRIHFYDFEAQNWDYLQLESPFTDNKLTVLDDHAMVWKWAGNRLYLAAELEPARTFIVWFDLDTLKWFKMKHYFLNPVYSVITNYNGDVFVETRHKTMYRGPNEFIDFIDQDELDGTQIDTKSYCFYRLNIEQPQSLLKMSFLTCRQIKDKHPKSNVAEVLDKMNFLEGIAPLAKMKSIPNHPIREDNQGRLDNALFPDNIVPAPNARAPRRSLRLRNRQNQQRRAP